MNSIIKVSLATLLFSALFASAPTSVAQGRGPGPAEGQNNGPPNEDAQNQGGPGRGPEGRNRPPRGQCGGNRAGNGGRGQEDQQQGDSSPRPWGQSP